MLVVDDDPMIREMLSTFLNSKGYRIAEAENGEQAVEITRSRKLSGVLLDIDMPVMVGLAALQEILKIIRDLGVGSVPSSLRMSH